MACRNTALMIEECWQDDDWIEDQICYKICLPQIKTRESKKNGSCNFFGSDISLEFSLITGLILFVLPMQVFLFNYVLDQKDDLKSFIQTRF